MAVFGNTEIGEQIGGAIGQGKALATGCKFTLSENGDLTSISQYIHSRGLPYYSETFEAKYGIYSDLDGVPNTFLGETETLIVGTEPSWVVFPFTTPLHLNAGTYWLILLTIASVTMNSFHYIYVQPGDTNQRCTSTNITSVFPSTFPTLTSYSDQKTSVYATYTPTILPPPPPTHNLSVATTPISGIEFIVNIGGIPTSCVTPWTENLEEGAYPITMPANVLNYKFVSWEDGSTDPTRTIILTAETSIIANYELISIINGKVIDAKTMQPIIGALVECNGKETNTDELGNYSFDELSPNIYTINVSAAGYTGQAIEVDASAGGTFTQDFSLTLSPLPINKTALVVGSAFAAAVGAVIYIGLKKKGS